MHAAGPHRRLGTGLFEVLLGLLAGLLHFRLLVHLRLQLVDRVAKALAARHPGSQLVEWNAEIVRDVGGGHKLAEVLKTRSRLRNVGAGGQQTFELRGKLGILR